MSATRYIGTVYPELKKTTSKLIREFDEIPAERKKLLFTLTEYIQSKRVIAQPVNLIFICTHNSRRSHISQIWAQTAAHLYNVPDVFCYSGGTEATAFNPRAVNALRQVGFNIEMKEQGNNPIYEVRFSNEAAPILAFSKVYNDAANPQKSFAAIMTCSHADENCPLVFGTDTRIALTYDDPKDFDGTDLEETKYQERVNEIGREILFAFSGVNG